MHDRARSLAPGKQSNLEPRASTLAPGKRTLVESIGAPLPDATLAKFERSFGQSFADVRVHQSGEPAALGAAAFARGNEIHVAPGRYAPGTVAGDRLLGHELAHVVQQRGGRVAGEEGVVNADASLESEADALGARAAAGEVVRTGGPGAAPASPAVQAAPIQCIDQRDDAKLPTTAEQNTLRGHLDPNTRQPPQQPQQHNAPLPWDGEIGQPKYQDCRKEMRREMDIALDDFRQKNDAAVQAGRNAQRVPMTQNGGPLGDTGVLGIAQRSQAALAARFGSWIANGVRSQGGKQAMTSVQLRSGHEIVDGNDEAQRRRALGVGNTAYAGDTAWWAARNHGMCRTMLLLHHWTPEGSGRDFLRKEVLDKWLAENGNRAWVADYHTFCINEHARSSIILDTTINPHGHIDANAAERAKRWSLFGSSVHELMHGCAHPAFVAATRSRPVMHEGFTEYFAAQVSAPLVAAAANGADEPLRLVVEGSVATQAPQGIAAYHTPSAYVQHVAEVTGMRQLIGEQALLAAYFQGHVEFLGLRPDGGQSPDRRPSVGAPTLRVPPGITTLTDLAARSNLATNALRQANQGLNLQDDISMHDRLVMPDCREHIVVQAEGAAETLEIIARQHDMTKQAIIHANPDRPLKPKQQIGDDDTWQPLHAGDRILIPKRV